MKLSEIAAVTTSAVNMKVPRHQIPVHAALRVELSGRDASAVANDGAKGVCSSAIPRCSNWLKKLPRRNASGEP
ncbi:hypothetical protein Poly21_41740 [Allorhodopirellula heiligendammensis]|uniref:Uncharacterized protein n=1 Tax=Allorhodopirellula heiligendammensis TaxID=2714739 RepID=A0A5C6BYF5_9BACT|nr:hypothetical protein Poly21_41740 [Allorhodopirellula heiligendammensis]